MKSKVAMLLVFASSMASAVDSANTMTELELSDLDLCKVSYVDKTDGAAGTYRGQCVDGKPHGSGTVTFNNGAKINGTFQNGLIEGEGTYESSDGNIYKGMWTDGKRSGFGTFTWARGSTYEGEWVDDMRHGQGVFTWSNGNRFEGEFRNNKQYNGMYYTSNGRVYKCRLGQCR